MKPALQQTWSHHRAQARQSLRELGQRPLASLMTVAVLGLSLALPTAMYVLLKAGDQISGHWQQAGEISLFLQRDIALDRQQQLVGQIAALPAVDGVELVSPDDGLIEFADLSGFSEALSLLDENPLPPVIRVVPQSADPVLAQQLQSELSALAGVDQARLDSDWLRRLDAVIVVVKDGFWALAVMLGSTVLLIVGITTSFLIESRRDEIEITGLLGATVAFIRRPFLYTGLWLGGLSGVFAWWVVAVVLLWLERSLVELVALYGRSFEVPQLSLAESLALVSIAAILGWSGAALAVQRQLKLFQPG